MSGTDESPLQDPPHVHDAACEHGHENAASHDHAHEREHAAGRAPAHEHAAGRASAHEHGLPEATLQMHLFHLASQVSMALGDIENPISGKRETDLRAARFLIDLIAMLEQKTTGNRTPDEDTYIRGVLTNLRMAFVAKSK